MGVVESDFNQRCSEIESYIDYLQKLESQTGFDVLLLCTMKSSALLMIYNLMESTASNSIESIYDHLKMEKIGFISADDNLKAMVLKCAKAVNPSEIVKKMREELVDLAVAAFRKDGIFSGNVDSRKIIEIWNDYGIRRSGSYREDSLLFVKIARNDLAHGAKSFSELGKTKSVKEITDIYSSTKSLLYKALKDVEKHISTNLKKAAA
ncbi:MAE_28990/MAE_18760 family HEPN-like nuclease [Xanthomonas campestris]|uniref:MAE_28990/MAE_18760 family HEPN-like nuclease n=1 Tax=Xanthomonas campestris TaxID=339 RepID=UPI001F1E1BBB|nr:MAE_28990/MAE_18760 family HEPN-like nuclease [Xanthomonas campestris]MCF8795250.1 hypothetical protein [Xanthomonas campestris pv. campestris]MCF8812593.1 hypothetical protein [Xanthomonas campestris pv. campestris]WHO89013.1 MAE_28990/MAE_18760 family HEPN-like nuclease [Xanthomonas campestris]